MSPLSSRRYTECVDRLNAVLGRVSRYLEQQTKLEHTYKPKFTTVDGHHRIVKCGNNLYKYSNTNAGRIDILIWKNGWKEVICAHDDRSPSEIIQNFEWEANP